MNIIKKFFIKPLGDYVAQQVIIYWRNEAMEEMAWLVFSTLGLDTLDEALLEKATDNLEKKGHTDYRSISGLYRKRIKKLAIERIKEIEETLKKL